MNINVRFYLIFFLHSTRFNPSHFSVGQLPITAFPKNRPDLEYILSINENRNNAGMDLLKRARMDSVRSKDTNKRPSDEEISVENQLRSELMGTYSADLRPVENTSTITYVNLTLTNIQIIKLDEQNQIMITSAHIYLKWYDENLKWDPAKYGNISKLIFNSKDIWTPDIALFNSADIVYSNQRDNYLLSSQSDGFVLWVFPDLLKSYCSLNIRFFPFDRQDCKLEFQPWSRSKKEVIVVNDNRDLFVNHTLVHTEWELLRINITEKEENDYLWLEYNLHLKRNWAFYVNNMLFPFSILSSLSFFVFWLPPDSGEKITLTITILLALTLFLQIITEYTPRAAKSMPIIALYFNVNLILVLISIILTIIVLNFHFRGPKKQRVPLWMRKYLIGYFGRFLCFSHESRIYFQKIERFKLNCVVLNGPKRDRNSKKEKPLVEKFESHLNTKTTINGTHLKHQPSSNSVCTLITTPGGSTSAMTATSKETLDLERNLEKMIIKLNRSFDPLKLKDDNLKCILLAEILECQRNLLLKTKKKNNKKLRFSKDDDNDVIMSLNEIYDEWKVLAMVVDRICFFIYLILLLMIILLIYFLTIFS